MLIRGVLYKGRVYFAQPDTGTEVSVAAEPKSKVYSASIYEPIGALIRAHVPTYARPEDLREVLLDW